MHVLIGLATLSKVLAVHQSCLLLLLFNSKAGGGMSAVLSQ